MRNWRRLLLITVGALWGSGATAQDQRQLEPSDGLLSVMTYNVKGAPWPVTHGRGRALRAIAERLRQLRTDGLNPHIVVLQEAFSADARAIASLAGYRYVVAGPGTEDRTDLPASQADVRFLAGRSFWHGERAGKLFNSGLLFLSDYPVTRTARLAFPAFACAGFDCMANKGAMLVTIEIPGAGTPIDIVATHLNSRHSARVSNERSLYAYERQLELLSGFIQANRDPRHPLIVAGDFNVGDAPARGVALSAQVPNWGGQGVPVVEALHTVVSAGEAGRPAPATGADAVIRRNTDFEFISAGRLAELVPLAASVPFGRESSGGMLSDHIGYTITFRLAPRPFEMATLDAPARLPAPVAVRAMIVGRIDGHEEAVMETSNVRPRELRTVRVRGSARRYSDQVQGAK